MQLNRSSLNKKSIDGSTDPRVTQGTSNSSLGLDGSASASHGVAAMAAAVILAFGGSASAVHSIAGTSSITLPLAGSITGKIGFVSSSNVPIGTLGGSASGNHIVTDIGVTNLPMGVLGGSISGKHAIGGTSSVAVSTFGGSIVGKQTCTGISDQDLSTFGGSVAAVVGNKVSSAAVVSAFSGSIAGQYLIPISGTSVGSATVFSGYIIGAQAVGGTSNKPFSIIAGSATADFQLNKILIATNLPFSTIGGLAAGKHAVGGSTSAALNPLGGSASGQYLIPITGTSAVDLNDFVGLISGKVGQAITSNVALGISGSASGQHLAPVVGTSSKALAFSGSISGSHTQPFVSVSLASIGAISGSASGNFTPATVTSTSNQALSSISGSAAGSHARPIAASFPSAAISSFSGSASATFVAPVTTTSNQKIATFGGTFTGIGAMPPVVGSTSKQILSFGGSAAGNWSDGGVAWRNVNVDTVIDGPTFRQRFLDVFAKRIILLNEIDTRAKWLADQAKTIADQAWSDGIITPSEKLAINAMWGELTGDNCTGGTTTFTSWLTVPDGRLKSIYTQANTLNISVSELGLAIDNLRSLIITIEVWSKPTAATTLTPDQKANYPLMWTKARAELGKVEQLIAGNALLRLDDISSDNKLTPSEKAFVRQQWDAAYSNWTLLDVKAGALNIIAPRATYTAKFKALSDYLNGSTWLSGIPTIIQDANLGKSDTIDGPTFRLKWSEYFDAETALEYAISQVPMDRLDAIGSDNWLAKEEVSSVLDAWYQLNIQQSTLRTKALSMGMAYGAGTPIYNMDVAWNWLHDYLDGRAPASSTLVDLVATAQGAAGKAAINRNEWRTNWNNVYDTIEKLRAAVSQLPIDRLDAIASDNWLAKEEVPAILDELLNVTAAKNSIKAMAISLSLQTGAGTPFYNADQAIIVLNNFLYGTGSGYSVDLIATTQNAGKVAIDRNLWHTLWSDVYAKNDAARNALVQIPLDRLNAIAADGYLAKEEVTGVLTEWYNLKSAYDAERASAVAFGMPTASGAVYNLDVAWNWLHDYLDGRAPASSTLVDLISTAQGSAGKAQIDINEWRNNWTAVYSSLEALRSAVDKLPIDRLNFIADDNWLTKEEAPVVVDELGKVTSAKNQIRVMAVSLSLPTGLGTPVGDMDAALTTLTQYVNPLITIATGTAGKAAIDRGVWRNLWSAVYQKNDAVRSAIAQVPIDRLNDIAADNKVTPSEKGYVRAQWDIIAVEYPRLIAKASDYTVTTEAGTYTTKMVALGTYLNNLVAWTPANGVPFHLTDAEMVNTTTLAYIEAGWGGTAPQTWRRKWSEYYDAKVALETAISNAGRIAVDNIDTLTRSEKAQIVQDWTALSTRYSAYIGDSKIVALSECTAFVAACNSATSLDDTARGGSYPFPATGLTPYLQSLSPAWNDLTQSTPLGTGNRVRRYNWRWNLVQAAENALITAISLMRSEEARSSAVNTAQNQANVAQLNAQPHRVNWSYYGKPTLTSDKSVYWEGYYAITTDMRTVQREGNNWIDVTVSTTGLFGKIFTKNLYVANFDNLFTNPNGVPVPGYSSTQAFDHDRWAQMDYDSPSGYSHRMQGQGGGNQGQVGVGFEGLVWWNTNQNLIPVTPGDEYYIEALVKCDVQGGTGVAGGLYAGFNNGSTLTTSGTSYSDYITSGKPCYGWTKLSLIAVVPPGASWMRAMCWAQYDALVRSTNLTLRKRADATMIVDGEIDANKLVTDLATAKIIRSANWDGYQQTGVQSQNGYKISGTLFTVIGANGQSYQVQADFASATMMGGYLVGGIAARAMSAIGDNGVTGAGFRCWFRGNNAAVNANNTDVGGAPTIASSDANPAANPRLLINTISSAYHGPSVIARTALAFTVQPRDVRDNLDALSYIEVEVWYKNGGSQTKRQEYLPVAIQGRRWRNSGNDLDSANAAKASMMYMDDPDKYGLTSATYPLLLKCRIVNVVGESTEHWFTPPNSPGNGSDVNTGRWTDVGTVAPYSGGTSGGGGTGGGGGGWCPAPDVPILMADGSTKVAGNIEVGDQVAAWDETSGMTCFERVTYAEFGTNERMMVHLDNGMSGKFAINHRFLLSDGQWCELQNLEAGMELMFGVKVLSTESAEPGYVVKITVNRVHTYFTLGVISHNVKPAILVQT
jgi:hypothetical protein